jgi:hypothetical protein
MQHRWGLRREVDQAVHVWTPGLAARGQLRNISISGAFVASSLPVRSLGRVKLQIKGLKGADKAKFVVEGHIVRVARDGFAVEWCEFAPPSIRALIRNTRAQILNQQAEERATSAIRKS